MEGLDDNYGLSHLWQLSLKLKFEWRDASIEK